MMNLTLKNIMTNEITINFVNNTLPLMIGAILSAL